MPFLALRPVLQSIRRALSGLEMHYDLADQTQGDRLNPEHHEQDAEEHQRAIGDPPTGE